MSRLVGKAWTGEEVMRGKGGRAGRPCSQVCIKLNEQILNIYLGSSHTLAWAVFEEWCASGSVLLGKVFVSLSHSHIISNTVIVF